MKTPAQIWQDVDKRLHSAELATWLVHPEQCVSDRPLGLPSEARAAKDIAAVRAWAAQWWGIDEPGVQVSRREVNWRIRGRQTLPDRIRIQGLDAHAHVAGATRYVSCLRARTEQLAHLAGLPLPLATCAEQAVECAAAVIHHRTLIARMPEPDWQRAVLATRWLVENPASGLTPRALPISGLDTKWVGRHRAVVQSLVATVRSIRGLPGGEDLGLASIAEPVFQVTWADPGLRPGGIRRAHLPVSELRELYEGSIPAGLRVLICENQETYRALEDRAHTLYLFGQGRQASTLSAVPWLAQVPVYYWGDLDTHGFAILADVRAAVGGGSRGGEVTYRHDGGVDSAADPGTVHSVLMDAGTLYAHRELWVEESSPWTGELSAHLTGAEGEVLATLRAAEGTGWAGAIRLEQERIAWDWATERLDTVLGPRL